MSPLVWLAGAAAAAAAAWLTGWPAWRSYRSRQLHDDNVERYNAWRGRASRGARSTSEGPTAEERRRLWTAAALAAVALLALAAFFTAS